MTYYHVFLPPPILSPLPLDHAASGPPLKPHILPRPPRDELGSQTSLSQRLQVAGGLNSLKSPIELSGQGVAGPSRVKKKRKTDGESLSANVADESLGSSSHVGSGRQSEEGRVQADSGGGGGGRRRRRSLRLSRVSDYTTGLPNYPGSGESILSLNTTTTSFPSQYPPTAADLSVHNLPQWHIPLTRLKTLQALSSERDKAVVSALVCVVAVETATVVRKSRAQEGDLWMGLWRTVDPDEAGMDVRFWGELAREWCERTRRGDLVLLESQSVIPFHQPREIRQWKGREGKGREGKGREYFRPATRKNKAELVVSNNFGAKPKLVIVYRTMPRHTTDKRGGIDKIVPEDKALRPDLRLARSDPGVRKVAECARWFAEWIGGEGPP
ncbi:hypothetical protein BCR39DRAFT_31153 [Naematelia encephala]|uniref:Uncharacterized protein n=1 Tax=Naematelia encephala TaxID=71784 RepID=A0A1Y2BNK6_9TREE|nr:hypothetical protein BCR39DRAFT_31153 [Naematelia encephala]